MAMTSSPAELLSKLKPLRSGRGNPPLPSSTQDSSAAPTPARDVRDSGPTTSSAPPIGTSGTSLPPSTRPPPDAPVTSDPTVRTSSVKSSVHSAPRIINPTDSKLPVNATGTNSDSSTAPVSSTISASSTENHATAPTSVFLGRATTKPAGNIPVGTSNSPSTRPAIPPSSVDATPKPVPTPPSDSVDELTFRPPLTLLQALVEAKVSTEPSPATELIHKLVSDVAQIVCTLRQNHQAAYTFVARTRDIRDKIDSLIKSVDTSDDWDSYNLYVDAVDPLERLLFEFEPRMWTYVSSSLLSDSTRSVDECERAVEEWSAQRKAIRQFSTQLQKETSLANVESLIGPEYLKEFEAAAKHDDSVLLSSLCIQFKNKSAVEWSAKTKPHIQTLETLVQGLRARSSFDDIHDKDAWVLSIKCAALLNTAAALCETAPNAEYMRSPEIWGPAQMLLTSLKQYLDGGKTKPESVEEQWRGLAELLKKTKDENVREPPEVTEAFEELRKRVAKVKRPYFTQAHVTVREFLDMRQRALSDTSHILSAFQSAREALDKAAATNFDLRNIANFNEEDISTNEAGTAFAVAQHHIKTCFEEYSIEDPAALKHRFAQAVKADKLRMKEMKEFHNRRRLLPNAGAQVKVTLMKHFGEIHVAANTDANAELLTYNKNTILSAVLGREILKSSAEHRPQLLTKSYFVSDDSKPLDLSTELSSLVKAGEDKVTLHLLIGVV